MDNIYHICLYTQYTHVVSYGATDVFGSEWQEFPGFGDWCASKGTVWTAMPKHVRWDLLFDFVGVKCHHLPAEKLSLTAAKTLARVHGCWCTVLWHGCFLLLDVQECSFFIFFWRSNWCFGSRGCNTLQGFWLIDAVKFPIPRQVASQSWRRGVWPWRMHLGICTREFQNSPKRLLHTVECVYECVRSWKISLQKAFWIGGV